MVEKSVSEFKLLFIGGMGAGKTTAITAVSEIPPVSTDVANNDRAAHEKALTTVSLDYGRITLPNGDRLRLYGIPGQERFGFMWPLLEKDAMGGVLLIDAGKNDPFRETEVYLEAFSRLFLTGRAVVGVGRLPDKERKRLDDFNRMLSQRGLNLPLFSVDVRKKSDVLLLLDALFTQIEVAEQSYSEEFN